MPALSYQRPGFTLGRPGTGATDKQIRDLQRHLRGLGYLKSGIDGAFGSGTERAVKALQHDLLNNDGSGPDGSAPVRVLDYNGGRVDDVTGVVDQEMAACISDMLDDHAFPKLPSTDDPVGRNIEVLAAIASMTSRDAPIPFVRAILKQEANLQHFHEPRGGDEDSFIVVGLDTNASEKHIITSRGYGAGQNTLFHHPPTHDEVADFMLDPGKNLQKAIAELRGKFDHFVIGPTSGTQADDRFAELGRGALQLCKYRDDDDRYMRDCRQCAVDADLTDIVSGVTRWYEGSSRRFEPTQYYKSGGHRRVPVRKNVGCDWPYAARRYNGAGTNSYHYQAIVLKNLLTL